MSSATRGEMETTEIPKDEMRQFPNGSWYVCMYYIPYGRYGVVKHYKYVDTEDQAICFLRYSRRS